MTSLQLVHPPSVQPSSKLTLMKSDLPKPRFFDSESPALFHSQNTALSCLQSNHLLLNCWLIISLWAPPPIVIPYSLSIWRKFLWLSISGVHRHWKDIALSTGPMWTEICISTQLPWAKDNWKSHLLRKRDEAKSWPAPKLPKEVEEYSIHQFPDRAQRGC